MTFPNGQEKLMTFTDVRPNAPIDPATFRDRRSGDLGDQEILNRRF
jgi:hypothetical protein